MKFETDPYQIDYALIQDVEVLREGTWNWTDYNKDFMDEIAMTYDPAMLRAKLIRDHEYYGPAFGHILALRVEDDMSAEGAHHLMATVGFLAEGKAMIESGAYNERSIGWALYHPTSGLAYLWEVSLLGANTPASVGMAPIVFTKELIDEMSAADKGKVPEILTNHQLTWEKTEEYIRHRLRNPSRFREETMRTIELDADQGIMAVVGKLKPEYVPEGAKPDSMIMQNVMFSLKKGWTFVKAKAWVAEHNLMTQEVVMMSVVSFQDLPLADEGMDWDNDAAEAHRREYAGGEDNIDWEKYRKGFLWYDSEDPEKFGSYKLPIADVIDGDLKAVPRGIYAAAGAISGARGGVDIPAEDESGVKTHLEKYYAKMDKKAPWQEDSQHGIERIPTLITLSHEGGKQMPETEGTTVVIEAGSPEDLAARNAALREAKEKSESEAQQKLIRENAELSERAKTARLQAIRSDVRMMQAEGYIVGPQIEMGLAEALAAIPDESEILVGDKKRKARDIIVDALKYGGQVKLKHEIAKGVTGEAPVDKFDELDAKGIDTSVERRRIKIAEKHPDWTYTQTLDQAYKEVRK